MDLDFLLDFVFFFPSFLLSFLLLKKRNEQKRNITKKKA